MKTSRRVRIIEEKLPMTSQTNIRLKEGNIQFEPKYDFQFPVFINQVIFFPKSKASECRIEDPCGHYTCSMVGTRIYAKHFVCLSHIERKKNQNKPCANDIRFW